MMMDYPYVYFQWGNLAGCVLLVLLSARMWWHYRDIRALIMFPGLWGLAGVVFYSLVLGDYLSPAQILLWGAVHRLLAIAMVLMFLVGLYALALDDAGGDDGSQE